MSIMECGALLKNAEQAALERKQRIKACISLRDHHLSGTILPENVYSLHIQGEEEEEENIQLDLFQLRRRAIDLTPFTQLQMLKISDCKESDLKISGGLHSVKKLVLVHCGMDKDFGRSLCPEAEIVIVSTEKEKQELLWQELVESVQERAYIQEKAQGKISESTFGEAFSQLLLQSIEKNGFQKQIGMTPKEGTERAMENYPFLREHWSGKIGDPAFDDVFARLRRSKFRASFHLNERDRAYVREKGKVILRLHAAKVVAERLAPAHIPNDGKQTPMRGHPVFRAQHACACCCRGCFEKWYHIPVGQELTKAQQNRVTDLLVTWILNETKD